MAWAYKRGARWYAGYRDRRGKRRARVLRGVSTKTEARRIANEIEAREDRIRLGLERPATDVDWTVLDLLEWWLERYSAASRSYRTDRPMIAKHVAGSTLASVRIDEPDLAGEVTRLLRDCLESGLAPKSTNNLRGYLHVCVRSRQRGAHLPGAEPDRRCS